jgi:hypothetical protein
MLADITSIPILNTSPKAEDRRQSKEVQTLEGVRHSVTNAAPHCAACLRRRSRDSSSLPFDSNRQDYSTLALMHNAHNIFLPFRARGPYNHLLSAIFLIM